MFCSIDLRCRGQGPFLTLEPSMPESCRSLAHYSAPLVKYRFHKRFILPFSVHNLVVVAGAVLELH